MKAPTTLYTREVAPDRLHCWKYSAHTDSALHTQLSLQRSCTSKYALVERSRGTPQALNDVISGRVPMVIDAYPPLTGALKAGAIRALAVGATKRLPDFPDLPTVAVPRFGDDEMAPPEAHRRWLVGSFE